jgi:hypothetical protein
MSRLKNKEHITFTHVHSRTSRYTYSIKFIIKNLHTGKTEPMMS